MVMVCSKKLVPGVKIDYLNITDEQVLKALHN